MKALSTSVMTALIVSIAACGGKKSSGDEGNQNPPVQSETKPAPERSKDADPKSKESAPAPSTTNSQTSTPPVSNTNASAVKFKESMQGLWKSACRLGDGLQISGTTTSYKFDGSNVSLIDTSFSDQSCANSSFSVRQSGLYSINDPAVIKSGGYKTSYKFDSIYLTPNSPTAASSFNLYRICGFSNWSVGDEKKVSGTMPDCDIAGSAEKMFYVVYTPVLIQTESSLSIYSTDNSKDAVFNLQKQ